MLGHCGVVELPLLRRVRRRLVREHVAIGVDRPPGVLVPERAAGEEVERAVSVQRALSALGAARAREVRHVRRVVVLEFDALGQYLFPLLAVEQRDLATVFRDDAHAVLGVLLALEEEDVAARGALLDLALL